MAWITPPPCLTLLPANFVDRVVKKSEVAGGISVEFGQAI